MSITPGDVGSQICDINPSDLVGNVDNILMRLNNLEQIVARMLGIDVSALQLADITTNAGILQNITQIYNTTTGLIHGMDYDTGLPMPQDGRDYYPIFNTVLIDGILVYRIVAWLPRTGSGTESSASVIYAPYSFSGVGTENAYETFTYSAGDSTLFTGAGSDTLTTVTAGKYLIHAEWENIMRDGSSTAANYFIGSLYYDNLGNSFWGSWNWTSGEATNIVGRCNNSRIVDLDAGDQIQLLMRAGSASPTLSCLAYLQIAKLD